MHRIYIFALFLFISALSTGQTNLERNIIFGGNSTDEAKDVKVNNSKTALFLGAKTFSVDGDVPENAGGSDFWIMKMDIDGSPIWNKTYGGMQDDDLEVLLPHPDGGTLAFGTTRSSQGLFGTLVGHAGAWLMRTNNNGSIVDGKIFGGILTESGVDGFRHLNGDVTMAITAGSPILFGQPNNGILDVWIVRVDAAFNSDWSTLLGGAGADIPNAITCDINGNTYIAATSDSNLPGLPLNMGGTDLWIIKLDPLGEMLWQKNFGGTEDDVADDIVLHPDGNLYVIAHSLSADGDFDSNYGINDLWMLKLNGEDGSTEGKYHYGGTGNEFDAQISLSDTATLIITSSSTSNNLDLTGNKGFADVWNFTTDRNGNIRSQMNYGGSLNDFSAQVITVDSIHHVFSTTLSMDKNVPANGFSQLDTWYYTLNPYPDTCSTNFVCLPDSSTNNHIFPPADNSLICVVGCNAGFGPGPSFFNGMCPDFLNSTSYFFITTDTNADLLTLSVHSEEFNKPQIALLRTVNCTTFQQVDCITGEDGNAVMNYIDIAPQTTYVIAISDAEGNFGEFELCATSIDVEFCNKNDRIFVTSTSMGSNFVGPFKPGEEVQVCYELDDWDKLECNGFQGVIPTFGPGWDTLSFDLYGEPIQTDSMFTPATVGEWAWHRLGEVHYNISNPVNGYEGNQGLPAGWYFTNTTNSPPADEPDQTTGDIDNCLANNDSWKVCFTLKVVDQCESNLDCSITMKTFADGEIGRFNNLVCGYDQKEVFTASMVCCVNPSMQPIQNYSICSGDTLIFKPETNLFPPVTYSWTADPDPFIMGAASANNLPQFYQQLFNETAIPLTVRYSIKAQSEDCETDFREFEVTVLPVPSSKLTISGPNIVCSGSTVRLNFESSGTPPFAIGLFKDNQLFANVLSESTFFSIDIDPIFSGVFRIGSIEDAFCDGFGTGFVNVTVKPAAQMQIDTTICAGESIAIADQVFDQPGTYTVVIENGAENNCDSVVTLILEIAPSLTETINEVICNGDTIFVLDVPYTVTVDTIIEYAGPENCPNYIMLSLLVKDTFSMEIKQTICNGDTLIFGGVPVFDQGSYSSVEEIRPGCFEETILNLSVLPAIFINDLAIVADNGSGNGAILVEIIGGAFPLSYMWNTGQTTESLFNISAGDYQLTVTDNIGCDQIFMFTVPMVSSTENVFEATSSIKIWPTLLSSNDKVQLFNSGDKRVEITSIDWISISGLKTNTRTDLNIEAGGTQTASIPAHLSAGLHFIKITIKNNPPAWAKIFVVE